MINAGELDRQIILQSNVRVRDEYGFLESTYIDYNTVWAKFDDRGRGEYDSDGLEVGYRRAKFTIRFDDNVKTSMRVVYNNRTWDIESINEIGRREGLILDCESRDFDIVESLPWILDGGLWNDGGQWDDAAAWVD